MFPTEDLIKQLNAKRDQINNELTFQPASDNDRILNHIDDICEYFINFYKKKQRPAMENMSTPGSVCLQCANPNLKGIHTCGK